MKVKAFVILAALFSPLCAVNARITASWSYQGMFDKSDLVVIATFVSTENTAERASLLDIEPHFKVVGVVSAFKSCLILKGPHKIVSVQLHHYLFQSKSDELAADSPALLSSLVRGHRFLLFLVKEADGRYAPVTGQTDPALMSVLELQGGAT